MRWHEQVPRHERLVDALSDDILGAGDADVLASHTAAAARVAADAQRQALLRAIAGAVRAAAEPAPAPRAVPARPGRDDGERR